MLHVDTTYALSHGPASLWHEKIDYRVYDSISPAWRRIEERLRFDFTLARAAIARSGEFDVLLCGSEKVGIPLALLGCRKPIVTVVHNLFSQPKAAFLRLSGLMRKWARMGVYCRADAEEAARVFGYPLEHTFNYCSAPLGRFNPGPMVSDGVVLSAGSASRDYATLVEALRELPDHRTEIYAASRFGDRYRGRTSGAPPPWVRFAPGVPHAEIAERTAAARFVVVPITPGTQFAAGTSSILEASASAKAVVATRTRGSVDYVEHGVTGFLVPPGDAAAMREAIRVLWNDPALAHRMGLAGRAFCEGRLAPHDVNLRIRAQILAAHRRGAIG